MAPSSFGAWLNHIGTQHVGAISFLLSDFFLFFGVAVLTVVQASQVCFQILFKNIYVYASVQPCQMLCTYIAYAL